MHPQKWISSKTRTDFRNGISLSGTIFYNRRIRAFSFVIMKQFVFRSSSIFRKQSSFLNNHLLILSCFRFDVVGLFLSLDWTVIICGWCYPKHHHVATYSKYNILCDYWVNRFYFFIIYNQKYTAHLTIIFLKSYS